MTGRAIIGEMLAEIHEEMSELIDKQVNVQKESLKKLPGFMKNSRKPTKKRAMKMKETKKKNDGRLNLCHGYQMTSGLRFFIH